MRERYGVSDAAKERGVLAVGNVIDTQEEYPGTIVASALWHMEPSIDHAITQVNEGGFAAEDYGRLSHLGAGGCSIAPMDESLVPADVIAKVAEKEAAIGLGDFVVEINDEEPKSTQ